jgi:hypothetical protein
MIKDIFIPARWIFLHLHSAAVLTWLSLSHVSPLKKGAESAWSGLRKTKYLSPWNRIPKQLSQEPGSDQIFLLWILGEGTHPKVVFWTEESSLSY